MYVLKRQKTYIYLNFILIILKRGQFKTFHCSIMDLCRLCCCSFFFPYLFVFIGVWITAASLQKYVFFQSVGIITFSVTTCAFLKALDLWAMGVTLYCFVFGKVSLHIFCNTNLTETNLISVGSHAC